MRKLLTFPLFVTLFVFLGAGAAFAQEDIQDVTGERALPITWQATLAAIIMAVVIPWLTAFLTKPDAPSWVKSLVAVVLAFLGAFASYLIDLEGVPNWEHVVGLMFTAIIGAAGFRTVADPGVEPAITASSAGFGIGGPPARPVR